MAEDAGMKFTVTLRKLDIDSLAQVMASMPSKDDLGRPVGITPVDAVRWALRFAAKELVK